ncbi:MAG: hypothetical protein IVW57_00040 [Ktedonobacterales bacterium]|nr:hypothetical protein [Ktedonobacterales bacterium]
MNSERKATYTAYSAITLPPCDDVLPADSGVSCCPFCHLDGGDGNTALMASGLTLRLPEPDGREVTHLCCVARQYALMSMGATFVVNEGRVQEP